MVRTFRESSCCSCCSPSFLVYTWWAVNTAISASFAALAIVTSRHTAVTYVYNESLQDQNLGKAGIMIACILGTVMVLAYSFISLLILLGYGQLLSSSLHVSMFMLLAALVLTSFNSTIDRSTAIGIYPGTWAAIFKCTFGLAYVLVASYLVLFFLFWLCKSAFIDHPTTTIVVESRNPSGTAAAARGDANATVAVITKQDIKNAQKAAKAAQKVAEFNKTFGGQAETVV